MKRPGPPTLLWVALAVAILLGALHLLRPWRDSPPDAAHPAAEVQTVVLLHGLGRTSHSMDPLVEPLEAAGYRVVNLGYPSREETPDELADLVAERIRQCCARAPKVHFVSHSLGGILVRLLFADHRSPPIPRRRLGRVVMLSPPNQGSEVVDAVGTTVWFEALMGPTGQLLGTGDESLPNRLGPAPFEVGVITGDVSLEPHLSFLIPGPDDGKVAVDRARLEGMEDFLVVPESHPFIMASPSVARQVVLFLREGRFEHPPTVGGSPADE